MNELRWGQPVKVGLGGAKQHSVTSPIEALACLEQWSVQGSYFEIAKDRCRAAVETTAEPADARRAFVAAMLEAAIPFA